MKDVSFSQSSVGLVNDALDEQEEAALSLSMTPLRANNNKTKENGNLTKKSKHKQNKTKQNNKDNYICATKVIQQKIADISMEEVSAEMEEVAKSTSSPTVFAAATAVVAVSQDIISNTDDSEANDQNIVLNPQQQFQSILKLQSQFPKPKTVEDAYPVPIVIDGVTIPFTLDKYGKSVPFFRSFWFTNRKYELKAFQATKNYEERRRQKLEITQQHKLLQMKETMKINRQSIPSAEQNNDGDSAANINVDI
jgi:hypothetical protein